MHNLRYDDAAKPDNWDQEAYDEAERAWQEWQTAKKGKTLLSAEERQARAEKCRRIVERHYEEKQRRMEAMMCWKEMQDEEAEEMQDEESIEGARDVDEGLERMRMVVWFTCILISVLELLGAVLK